MSVGLCGIVVSPHTPIPYQPQVRLGRDLVTVGHASSSRFSCVIIIMGYFGMSHEWDRGGTYLTRAIVYFRTMKLCSGRCQAGYALVDDNS